MTLLSLQSRHPELFERVSPHGLATIRADGMTGEMIAALWIASCKLGVS